MSRVGPRVEQIDVSNPDSAYFTVTALDEAMHDVEAEAQWNESAFFHLVVADGRRGALFRIGRRVNEGMAEVTALELRDTGEALVAFERPSITDNENWTAGNLDFVLADPGPGWNVSYDGSVSRLDHGEAFLDPGRALRESPRVAFGARLTAVDIVPPYRTTTDRTYHGGAGIAKDHYAGVARVSGTLKVDGIEQDVTGFGFRDHSWGVRNWQSIDCWRWLYGQLDVENIFSIVVMYPTGGEPDVAGILIRNGRPSIVTDATLTCRYGAAPHYWVEAVELVLPHADGPVVASFAPVCRLPLRHRKGEEVLRIVEQLAQVTIDGHAGAGWFETTDRIVDGQPFVLSNSC